MKTATRMHIGLSLAALVAAAQPALAQAKDEYPVPVLDSKIAWWCILYTGVFLIGSLVVAFKNSRRTHLD